MLDALFADHDPDVPVVRGDVRSRKDCLPTPQVFEQALANVVYLATCPGGLGAADAQVIHRGVSELAEFYKKAWEERKP